MKITYSLFAIVLLLVSACAPQAEFVKTKSELSDLREDVNTSKARIQELQKRTQEILKRLDALDANMKGTVDVQKVMADYGAKTDQLSTDIQLLQGRLEENNFRIADVGQKLDDKSFKITEISGRIEELEAKLKSLAAGPGVSSEPTGTADKKSQPRAVEPSEAYRQSMNDYNAGNYDLALAGFQNYLAQFPNASQADKAQYWIGESYYAKKEFSNAIDSFAKLLRSHPRSEKAAAAKLKIGYSYLNQNNASKAREWLNKVIKENPKTREAELAKGKLRKIGK